VFVRSNRLLTLDELINEFGLEVEYKERIVGNLVDTVYPASHRDLSKVGILFGDYLFGDPLEAMGISIDEIKKQIKEALVDSSIAPKFHECRMKHFDIDLAVEYIDNPEMVNLEKYKAIVYPLKELMFGNIGHPFNKELRGTLATALHSGFASQVGLYMTDPLSVVHYLFQNERENVRLELTNYELIRPHSLKPVYSADLHFYYKGKLMKKFRVVNQKSHRSGGWIESLRAYLDIKEWYAQHDNPVSRTEIPIEFPFGELGMIRNYYEFNKGAIPHDAKEELDLAKEFLRGRGRTSSYMENEYHLNTKTIPPTLIIVDFETFPGTP
jgi:hypothetical protein